MKKLLKPFQIFLVKIGIAFVLFSLLRLLFYAFNYNYFPEVKLLNFWGGVRFDWMTITILYAPFLLLFPFLFNKGKRVLRFLFLLSSFIAIAANTMDFEYFKFTFKRTTFDLFTTKGINNDIGNLLPTFLSDYWYLVLLALILLIFTGFLYRKTDMPLAGTNYSIANKLLFFVCLLPLYGIGFRGGLQYRPLNVIQASGYANAQNIPIVLNTPFTIIKSSYKDDIAVNQYFDNKELEQLYSPLQQFSGDSSKEAMNVVLLIMESFSKEYIGALNPYEGYTPFLDSLIGESLCFNNAFANGKKSIESLPAILSGLPTLMNTSYISSKYGSNRIESIASILNRHGYETLFYHGGENGTMGFNAFTQLAGVQHYLGRNEYPHKGDYDGNWGIFDKPFLRFCLEDLQERSKPFFASIFTLSSHHPYTVPEQYTQRFKGGPLPILKSVEYADFALSEFFKEAKKQVWFENTLFVITADHTSQSFRESYNTSLGMYRIPLIFYAPKYIKAEMRSEVVQQNDIFPSIVDQLGIASEFLCFGESVFQQQKERFAVNYLNGIYQLIEKDYNFLFDGENPVALYHYSTDSLLQENILKQETVVAQRMEQRLKAIIQQYQSRIKSNQLSLRIEK
jgi:phosphoglycerol transferase MdoB-like AlkP superfamily enzyme